MTVGLYWLKGLMRTAAGRSVGTAVGIALAVALTAVLGIFVVSAARGMTVMAIANVPVDWQAEIAADADVEAIRSALAQSGAKTVEMVGYAKVEGFSASTGGTHQVTGAGRAIGIGSDYLAEFPRQVTLLSGGLDGPVLFSQTAANLHAGVGDEITILRPGLPPATIKVVGVAAIPNVDALFQAVGSPSGLAPQAPPDNILILPAASWHALFDPQRAARPDSVRTQFHIRLDRARLPGDPVGAYAAVKQLANHFEARVAGSAALADNLAARLDGVRSDALYAKVLFLFLGAPGVVLAVLMSAAIAATGRTRRMREQALLRVRGARLAETLSMPLVEAIAVGLGGALLGVLLANCAILAVGMSASASAALGWNAFAAGAGVVLAVAIVLVPALRDARMQTVARARAESEFNARPLWERLRLDAALLVLAAVVFWRVQGSGYQIVLANEGAAQTAANYEAFLAPLALWAGLGLLWVRLSRRALTTAASIRNRALSLTAGDLAPMVGASLSRQASRLARGTGLLALAAAFAVSTAVFNETYRAQARVDAELTNGADVNVTGSTAHPAGAKLDGIRTVPGVDAAQAMMHRHAYVGGDLQDLYGIDAATIRYATAIANAYFADGDAKGTLAKLAATRDGVLVSEETVRDFQLQPGDTVNLRLQSDPDHQYHVVPFRFVGIVREFPTAPKDSFLVANAAYVAKATGSDAHEVVLVRASDPAAAAARLKSALASDPALKVTSLGETTSLIASSLTAVNLSALTGIELIYGLAMIAAAAGLVLALGFAERQRTYAILMALGATPKQLGGFLRSEAALVTTAGLVFGTLTGFGVAWMLVVMLARVFDPPPEALVVPSGYLFVVIVGAAAVAVAVVLAFGMVHRKTDVAALKPQ